MFNGKTIVIQKTLNECILIGSQDSNIYRVSLKTVKYNCVKKIISRSTSSQNSENIVPRKISQISSFSLKYKFPFYEIYFNLINEDCFHKLPKQFSFKFQNFKKEGKLVAFLQLGVNFLNSLLKYFPDKVDKG